MTTIVENIGSLMGAITAKLNVIPQLQYEIKDQKRPGQAIGGLVLIRHEDYPDYDAGGVWVGSAVAVKGNRRSAQPQDHYDNVLEVKAEVNVPPKYMFKWLEQGSAMEINFRQTKPDVKVRIDNIADQVARWAHVLMQVTPGHVVDTTEGRRRAAEEAAKEAEAQRLEEIKTQLRRAREEARESKAAQVKEDLLRDYADLVYDNVQYGYGEDPVKRALRDTVQAQAGFQLSAKTRNVQNPGNTGVEDARPWFELDGSYCKPFSAGEIRAMLDALRVYRDTTPRDEWYPKLPDGEEEEVLEAQPEEEQQGEVTLGAALLLSVPLPDQMDD